LFKQPDAWLAAKQRPCAVHVLGDMKSTHQPQSGLAMQPHSLPRYSGQKLGVLLAGQLLLSVLDVRYLAVLEKMISHVMFAFAVPA